MGKPSTTNKKRTTPSFTSYVGKLCKKAQAGEEGQLSVNGAATKFLNAMISHVLGEVLESTREVSTYFSGRHDEPGTINHVRLGGRPNGTLTMKAVKAGTIIAVPGLLRDEAVDAGMRAVHAFKDMPFLPSTEVTAGGA